jgi:hypothetical protein
MKCIEIKKIIYNISISKQYKNIKKYFEIKKNVYI